MKYYGRADASSQSRLAPPPPSITHPDAAVPPPKDSRFKPVMRDVPTFEFDDSLPGLDGCVYIGTPPPPASIILRSTSPDLLTTDSPGTQEVGHAAQAMVGSENKTTGVVVDTSENTQETRVSAQEDAWIRDRWVRDVVNATDSTTISDPKTKRAVDVQHIDHESKHGTDPKHIGGGLQQELLRAREQLKTPQPSERKPQDTHSELVKEIEKFDPSRLNPTSRLDRPKERNDNKMSWVLARRPDIDGDSSESEEWE